MTGPRQNRTITVFFAVLRGTRVLIALATVAAITALILWLGGKGDGG